jgi:uncharacterized protein (TIGR03790 family)
VIRNKKTLALAWFLLLPWRVAGGAAEPAAIEPMPGALGTTQRHLESPAPPLRRWTSVPRIAGRLGARDLGLVINTADPYSVAVGAFYARARRLGPSQVLRVALPLRATLTVDEFEALRRRIEQGFGPSVQALALAWTMPYAVGCNSITGALALGFDAELCRQSCAPSRPSKYYASASSRPYSDLGLRPSMLLAARDVATAKALIGRGVASDRSLGLRGAPPVHAHFLVTDDRARSVRAVSYPPEGPVGRGVVRIEVTQAQALDNAKRVLLYMTGSIHVPWLETVRFVPGALADHFTSFGGQLDERGGQMSVLSWIDAGATASHGTVSEPCSHAQKFPHPQVLLLEYLQGSTAIEAYWKSVAWPQQSLFVGEPLAAPFAQR